MLASCWVARKIFLSPFSASSSARTLDSRPTTKGVIMKGKMTTSRIGIMGSLRLSKRSWLWLTIPPWGTGFSPVKALLSRAYYTLWHAATVQILLIITKVMADDVGCDLTRMIVSIYNQNLWWGIHYGCSGGDAKVHFFTRRGVYSLGS